MTELSDEHVEALARAAHRHYAAVRARPSSSWAELGDREREANLDSARFGPTILRALGLDIVRGVEAGGRASLTDEELDAGARLEHLRWCRFTRGSGRTDHPDLVPWDELDEPTRELDRMRVRELPRRLAQLGYSVMDRDDVS